MKSFLFILFFSLLSLTNSFSQNFELLSDLNPGDYDGCPRCWVHMKACALTLGDGKIVFIGDDGVAGKELFLLHNDEISLLKDIWPGVGGGAIEKMTLYKGKAYFVAHDGNGAKIWESDGTPDGTKIAFDLGDQSTSTWEFRGMDVSYSDDLYFTYAGDVYIFNGEELKVLEWEDDIEIYEFSFDNLKASGPYKEGLAILDYREFEGWELLSIQNGNIEKLATLEIDDSFKEPHGVFGFKGGVVFSVDASFDEEVEGLYVYLESDGQIHKVQDNFTKRSESINQNSCLVYGYDRFTLFNEDFPMGKIISEDNANLNQAQHWPRKSHNDVLLYYSQGGTWDDPVVSVSDGSNESDQVVGVLEDDYLSRMIAFDEYILFVSGTSNGYTPKLYSYNVFSGELTHRFTFPHSSTNLESVQLLGVQGDKIYISYDLDDAVGREVFSLEHDFISADENISLNDIDIQKLDSDRFSISTELDQEFMVEIFNINGMKLDRFKIRSNEDFSVKMTGQIVILVKNNRLMKARIFVL